MNDNDVVNLSSRLAACVVPWRGKPGDDLEVFIARRAENLSFLAGFGVFPGGQVDPVDHRVSVRQAPEPAHFCSAALRELFEETGILKGVDARPPFHERASLRRALGTSSDAWEDFLARHGGLVATDLTPMGRWITPPFVPVSYDAQYFALELSSGERPEIWPGEFSDGAWYRPAVALAAHESGALFLAYPVRETLKLLQTSATVTEAARNAHARAPHEGGEMARGIHMFPVRTYTLPPATHTNTYLLGCERLVIVDPASPIDDEQQRLLRYIRQLQASGAQPVEIWLTHQHGDHVGGVEHLRRTLNLPVAAHRLTQQALGDALTVDRFIADGEVTHLPNGDRPAPWQALLTPGHAAGHLCFYEQERGHLLSGDNVVGLGTVVVAPPEGDMSQYLASLRHMADRPLGMLFPSHGPPIATARQKIESYIHHRCQREATILATLSQPLTPAEVVARVYNAIPPANLPLAQLIVQAHLKKLLDENRVTLHDGRYVHP